MHLRSGESDENLFGVAKRDGFARVLGELDIAEVQNRGDHGEDRLLLLAADANRLHRSAHRLQGAAEQR